VRFAELFHLPNRGNQFIGDYKDFIGGLRVDGRFTDSLQIRRGFTGFTGFTGLRRPVRTYKEL